MKAKRYDTVSLRERIGSFPKGAKGAVVEVYTSPYEAYDIEIVTDNGETKGLLEAVRLDQIEVKSVASNMGGQRERAGALGRVATAKPSMKSRGVGMDTKLFRQIAAEDVPLQQNPFKSELVMEAFLIENDEIIALDAAGARVLTSQLHITGARPQRGTAGRVDILCALGEEKQSSKRSLGIVEVKNGELSGDSLDQLNDYLTAFKNHQAEVLNGIDGLNAQDYSDYAGAEVIGILVGTSISEKLKAAIEGSQNDMKHRVAALTIERYSTKKRDENYFIVRYFQSRKSSKKVFRRFANFTEFIAAQDSPPAILDAAKSVHEYLRVTYDPDCERVNYAPNDFTFNIPKKKKRRVFAYVRVGRTSVKVYLTDDGVCPPEARRNSTYPDVHEFELKTRDDLKPTVKDAIERSYRIILGEDTR